MFKDRESKKANNDVDWEKEEQLKKSMVEIIVVRSQTASLIPGPSFAHNLCCKCPNGSCEAILDIYTSRPFQRYKIHLDARCFGPCNCILSFWESRRIPKSHFRECEW